MKTIKNLKSNKPISTLSEKELTTVKGGGGSASKYNNQIYQFQKLVENTDPPRELEGDPMCSFY